MRLTWSGAEFRHRCTAANVITDAQAEIVGNLRPVVADAERLHEESARSMVARSDLRS